MRLRRSGDGSSGLGEYWNIGMRYFRMLTATAALSLAIGSAAIAQSGSAGGSIGNDEKSLSGSREQPRTVEPAKPARRGKSESEEPRRTPRKGGGESAGGGGGGGGSFDGVWVAVSNGVP